VTLPDATPQPPSRADRLHETLLITHAECLEHRMQPRHMERPERLEFLLRHFERTGLLQDLQVCDAPLVDPAHLRAVHAPDYLATLEQLRPAAGLARLDADTALNPCSLNAASRAAGAVVDAVDRVTSGRARRAFCAVRPPGHHAESGAGMGFCFYNSVCVAARHALDDLGVDRIAILDFDVHHGNGTVEIMQEEPRALVCSSFQFPFYPGRYDRDGGPNTVLTPLDAGTAGAAFRRRIEAEWVDRLIEHRPELILVSAGFDAHRQDPLGGLDLVEDDFRWITRLIVGIANDHCAGRVVSVLEGGYDLDALARSAHVHVEALLE